MRFISRALAGFSKSRIALALLVFDLVHLCRFKES